MPHIKDQRENMIHQRNMDDFNQILNFFKYSDESNSDTELFLNKISPVVEGINIDQLSDPSDFIEKSLYPLLCSAGVMIKENGNLMSIYQKSVLVILKKIINIFSERTKNPYDLSLISKYLNKKITAFFKKSYSSSVMSFSNTSFYEKTEFYRQCVSFITKQCINLVKMVWNMPLIDLVSFVSFINQIHVGPMKQQDISFIQGLYVQLQAFFKSGRQQLVKYVTFNSDFTKLLDEIQKRASKKDWNKNAYDLALILIFQFFSNEDRDKKQKGLQLFDIFLDDYYKRTGYSQQDLRKWIKQKKIFQIIAKDPKLFQANIESRLFRDIKKYSIPLERLTLAMNLVTANPESQKIWNFFADFDFYYVEIKEREMILDSFKKFPNFRKIPYSFFRVVQDLTLRETNSIVPDVFNFMFNMIRSNYQFWQDSNRSKSLQVFKTIYKKYLSGPFRSKSIQACNKEIRQLMESLLSKADIISLELFVIMIIKLEGWKNISHATFKEYLTSLVEKFNLFEQVFSMAQQKYTLKSSQTCQEQLVRFIIEKIDFNNSIFKYVANFTKSPQLFVTMMEKAKVPAIQDCMKFLLQYYRENPEAPLNIFKITFEKLNHSQFSSFYKVPSLLSYEGQAKRIHENPSKLKSYQQMSQLLLQTKSKVLREEICKYILDLYYNYSIKDRNSYEDYKGEETLLNFMKEIIETFERDALEYISKQQPIDNGLLVNMQLIKFTTLFTDILGCGVYKPHKSRAATSTIVLHVINNVTFGDDIQKSITKDFPSSMILFDALAIMGHSFKCGPEDIVLKRNGQFISSIYNSYSLEDLKLSSQDLIAQKNHANPLPSPQYTKLKKMMELPQNIIKIITEIFHRFAYEGKMGIIECTNFIRQSQGSQCISNDRRVKDVFEFDSDDDGILTLEDFIRYYKKGLINAYYEPDFNRKIKGFYNLRYRKNLSYYNEQIDLSAQYGKMMRFLVYNRSYTYNYLFTLSQDTNVQIAQKAQELLLLLPTPKNIEQYHIKPLQLAGKSQFQTYYILIQAVSQLNHEGMDVMEKKEKISGFLENKNNETIFRLLEEYHLRPERTDRQNKSMLICLRILRNLINIDQLSKLDLRTFDSKQITFPQLPQTAFFNNQTLQAFKDCDLINFETLLTLQLSQKSINIDRILQFCFDKSTQIRKIACNFLFLWSIKTNFSHNLFDIPVKGSNNQEWFEVLSALIQNNRNFDLQNVRKNAIKQLLNLSQTLYSRYNGLMNGYLKMLIAFSMNNKNNGSQYANLFDHLLNNTLSSINRSLVFTLIRNIQREYAYSYFQKRLTETTPSQECQVRQKYMGIKNLGAICYINSILQQFFYINKFKQLILRKNIPNDCKIVENKGQAVVDDFMYQLQRLYYYLQYSQKKYIVPNDFCFSFKNFEGMPINTTVQEDAHEFLNRLIEYSQESLKKEQKFKEFASVFQIKKLNLIECQKCSNRIEKYQNDYCLSVEVKGHNTLEDSLRKFTQKQVVADYFCEKCQQKVKQISKSTYLNHLPQILIVNLQRIVYDPKRGQKVKVHSKMSFPFQMDFKEYVKNDNPHIDAHYNLRGIVIHSGTSEAGHYYSLIKTEKDGWMKFNDQNVTSYNENEIDRECFGGLEVKDGFADITYSTNAYILFYQKKEKSSSQAFEIQNQFYTTIQKQNSSLINELQIHQQSFFTAITDSYEDIRLKDIQKMMINLPFFEGQFSSKTQRQYKQLLQIGLKAFRFIGIYTGLRQQTKWKIIKMIKQLYFLLPAQTIDLKHLNIRELLQDLIVKPSLSDRQMIKVLLFEIISIKITYSGEILATQHGQIYEIIKIILQYLQSTLFYLNIIKTESYLLLIFLLMKRFDKIKIIFHQQHLFFKMLELIMGKENPFYKHHPNLVDLSINLVPIVFDCLLHLLDMKTNLKGQKPMKQSHQLVTTFEAQILTNPSFFRRIQRLKYDYEAVGYIIQHFSTKDLDYSAIAADFLITSLNKKDTISNMPVFFNHVVKYLSIDDQFKTIRYGFIFGIPQNKEIQQGIYCLQASGKSENIIYISGLNYKNSKLQSIKVPLFQLAHESAYHSNYFSILCLQAILKLSIENDHIFEYIMNVPPFNYCQLTYYDWIEDYLEKVSKDGHIIFDKKIEKMSELININQIISQKANLILEGRKQPVQKYIIGKTKVNQKIGAIKDEDYEINFEKLTTYVLPNQPNKTENKSISSDFYGYHPSGVGHVFISTRSKFNYESEAKDVPIANTLCRVTGNSKIRLRLSYNRSSNPICIYLAEGIFTLTFPYTRSDTNEMDLFNIQKVKEQPPLKLHQIDINTVFPHMKVVPKPEMKMQQQKNNQLVFEDDSMIAQSEPKIKCGHCTYDNNITSQICQMCQQSLFR